MSYANLSLGMQGFGIASSAIGSFYSAKSAKSQLAFEAGMADINARIAEIGARQELLNGQQQVGALTLQAGHLKSKQRTAMAANGVDMSEGNAVELRASADLMKEIDRATIESNAVRSAWGYRTQAANSQADAAAKRGTASAISPFGSAAGSLLSGGGQVAQQWYAMNKAKR